MTSTLLLSRPVEARRAASALLSAFRLGAGQTLAGWPVLVGRCIFYVILLIVLSALWDKVVAERLPGTLAGELPPGGLALYIGVTEWITARRTLPFQLVIQKLMFLLGGLYAPVTLYPPALEAVAKASPFAAHLYWPSIQVIAVSREGFLTGLAWQGLWIALLSLACLRLWRAGLAKVLREGGV